MLDFSDMVTLWAITGIVLMLAELVIPGGIVIFLGGACLIVAGAVQLDLVNNWLTAMTLWFITSVVLIMSTRGMVQKMVGGATTVSNTEEDMDIYGKTATVIETIGPGEKPGRIEFQDTSWQAIADGSTIEAGETVTILCHENISLVVEKTI